MANREPSDEPRRIRITDLDLERLSPMVTETPAGEMLGRVLQEAETVLACRMPPNVVTMNSRFRIRDSEGNEREVSLVYPEDAGRSRVSVLSELGIALLGLSVGMDASIGSPHGPTGRVTVTEMVYQPEEGGSFEL